MAINAVSDMLRRRTSPTRSQRKVVQRTSCLVGGVYTLGLCVSRFSSEEIYSTEKKEDRDRQHAVKFSKGTWRQKKNWERKGPSRGIILKCEAHERSPCAPRFEKKTQKKKLAPRKTRPQSSMELSEKN